MVVLPFQNRKTAPDCIRRGSGIHRYWTIHLRSVANVLRINPSRRLPPLMQGRSACLSNIDHADLSCPVVMLYPSYLTAFAAFAAVNCFRHSAVVVFPEYLLTLIAHWRGLLYILLIRTDASAFFIEQYHPFSLRRHLQA